MHRQPCRVHRWGDRWSRVQRSTSVLHSPQTLQIVTPAQLENSPQAPQLAGFFMSANNCKHPQKNFCVPSARTILALRAGSQPHTHYVRARHKLASSPNAGTTCQPSAQPHLPRPRCADLTRAHLARSPRYAVSLTNNATRLSRRYT